MPQRLGRWMGILARLLAALLVLCVASEALYRLLAYWKNGTFQRPYGYDVELGWRTTPGYRSAAVPMQDRLGRRYTRSMRTDAHGSRLWGTRSGAPRLLFLGDSFTLGAEVSNAKTYSAVFSRLSCFDVYAYGGGAYGTLQEAMILKRLLHDLRPDVLVLQFARNDFTNNSLELERQTVLFQQMIRPYLVQGVIVHRFTESNPYLIALRYSRLFARMDTLVELALYRAYGDINRLPPGPERAALERQAVGISEQLLRRVASTTPPGTRLYAFNADESREKSNRSFEEISAKAGFRVIRNIASFLDAQDSKVETTHSQDGIHWNELGHRLVGERLALYFRNDCDKGIAPRQ